MSETNCFQYVEHIDGEEKMGMDGVTVGMWTTKAVTWTRLRLT